MKWRWVFAAALGAILTEAGGVLGADALALRQLARLPTVDLQIGVTFSFSPSWGLRLGWERLDYAAEMQALEQSLGGNFWDAEKVHRLGELARALGDDARAAREFARAVAYYRQRLNVQPRSGLLLASLGQSVGDTGDLRESERLLREAVRLAPKEWRCWMLLAHCLESRAIALLVGAKGLPPADLADQLLARVLSGLPPIYRPTPGELAEARRLADEAREAMDKAVEASMQPSSGGGSVAAQALLARGASRGVTQALLRGAVAHISGQKKDARQRLLPPEALADFRRASDMDPGNVRIVALAGLCEILGFAVRGERPWESVWTALPEESKAHVRRALERLERLTRAKDTQVAATACEALGVVAYLTHQETYAEENLRRAVKLDPTREGAWEVLAFVLATGKRYQDLVQWCQDRIATKDTPRVRLLLAKAYEKLGQLAQAEQTLRAAASKAPQDYDVCLGLAAMLLRRGDNAAVLAEAGEWLERAERAGVGGGSSDQMAELGLARGIYLALTGNVAAARELLTRVVERHPECDEARQALAALGK